MRTRFNILLLLRPVDLGILRGCDTRGSASWHLKRQQQQKHKKSNCEAQTTAHKTHNTSKHWFKWFVCFLNVLMCVTHYESAPRWLPHHGRLKKSWIKGWELDPEMRRTLWWTDHFLSQGKKVHFPVLITCYDLFFSFLRDDNAAPKVEAEFNLIPKRMFCCFKLLMVGSLHLLQ